MASDRVVRAGEEVNRTLSHSPPHQQSRLTWPMRVSVTQATACVDWERTQGVGDGLRWMFAPMMLPEEESACFANPGPKCVHGSFGQCTT